MCCGALSSLSAAACVAEAPSTDAVKWDPTLAGLPGWIRFVASMPWQQPHSGNVSQFAKLIRTISVLFFLHASDNHNRQCSQKFQLPPPAKLNDIEIGLNCMQIGP